MTQVMVAGCDLHERSFVLQVAFGTQNPMLKREVHRPSGIRD
jgi:hypothetical protein